MMEIGSSSAAYKSVQQKIIKTHAATIARNLSRMTSAIGLSLPSFLISS
jgi:hypothetical protein